MQAKTITANALGILSAHSQSVIVRLGIPSIFAMLIISTTICASRAEDASSGLDPSRVEELRSLMVALAPIGEPGFENPQTDILSLLAFQRKAIFGRPHDDAMPSDVRRKGEKRFETLLNQALDRLDLAALEKLVRKLPDSERLHGTIAFYFSERWIEEEVAVICADKNLKPSFPPRSYQPTSSELAWAHYHLGEMREAVDGESLKFIAQLLKPHGEYFAKAHASRVGPRPIQSEQDLKRDIVEFPNESPRVSAADVTASFASGWCATDMIALSDSRKILTLKCLLRDRKIAEAVGACLLVPAWQYEQWRVDLLTFAGLDWEEAMVASEQFDFLGAAGSEKGARVLLAVLAKYDGAPGPFGPLYRLAAFLSPGSREEWDADDRRRNLPSAAQAAIFAEFDKRIRMDAPIREMDENLCVLESLRRVETRPALRRLLAYPSARIARRAAALLRSFGDDIPEVAPQPDARFVLSMNGKPWRGAKASFGILGDGVFTGIETNAEGVVVIPRDELVDPAVAGRKLRFFHTQVLQPMIGKDGAFSAAWIDSTLDIPPVSSAPTSVALSVVPLPFKLDFPSVPKVPIMVELIGEHGAAGSPLELTIPPIAAASSRTANIKWVSPGKYRLHVAAAGFSQYLTEFFEVTPAMQPIPIRLEKGASVVAKVVFPKNAHHACHIRLFADGRDVSATYRAEVNVDSGSVRIDGLPKGNYQLRVLSTDEVLRSFGFAASEVEKSRKIGRLHCEGAAFDFRVSEDVSEMLDLGQIENNAVSASVIPASETR